MAYDITELKKLSTEEKLQIIDELWETIDGEEAIVEDTFDEDPEVVAMLKERVEKYERGEGVFYTLEESKSILNKRLEEFRESRNG